MNDPSRGHRPLRSAREQRGLSQAELAAAVGLSRQSIHAIESGRVRPRVDVALRIAHVLQASAESLFQPEAASNRRTAEPSEPDLVKGERVALAYLAGRWLAYPLRRGLCGQAADGIVRRVGRSGADIELLTSPAAAQQNIVMMGCAPALGLLAERLNQRSGSGRFLWLPTSSTAALHALAANKTHVAGVHLIDPHTGQQNLPDVQRHSGAGPRSLVALAGWEVGLVVQKGNPLRIHRLSSVLRSRRSPHAVRWVVREPGAGVQRHLEQALTKIGAAATAALYAVGIARSHLEVAQAVAMGVADVGLASQDAARACGVDFVPIAKERYDLALSQDSLRDSRVLHLLDALGSGSFRRELRAQGYDVRPTGSRVGDVPAA